MTASLATLANRLKAWVGYARARDVILQAEDLPAGDDLALDAAFAPDLSEANAGIVDAQGDLGANQAAGAANLKRRLARLEQNDRPVRELLGVCAGPPRRRESGPGTRPAGRSQPAPDAG